MQDWIWNQPEWPHFRWDPEDVGKALARSRLAQGKILGYVKLLDSNLALEASASILVEDSITTSAIEGEKLGMDPVRSSVARHLGLPPPNPLQNNKQSRAAEGIIQVLLNATQQFKQPLTLEKLCYWQAALFPTNYTGLLKISAGELRGHEPMQVISGRYGREKIHFIAPDRKDLDSQMELFLSWFNAPLTSQITVIDGLIRAGLAHLWFITLHPFEDGNGRLARAITDMAIAQDEQQSMRFFSLSSQILKERESYYNILENTQRRGLDVTPWLVWFLTQVESACTSSESIIERTLVKARFWLRSQHLNLHERQRKVLNRMLDAGPGGFEGGINIRKYMNLTKTSRATAYRELIDLVEKQCLIPTGKGGRSSAYDVIWISV